MQAANDNDGVNWMAPVRPSLRDIVETNFARYRAANDNLPDMRSAMEILRSLCEVNCAPPMRGLSDV